MTLVDIVHVWRAASAGFRVRAGRAELVMYAGLYAGVAMAVKGAGFILFLWIARTLTVADYAAFGLAYALQTGISTLALAGVIESTVGLLHENREQEHALLASANAACVLMTLPAVFCAAVGFRVFVQEAGVAGLQTLVWVIASATLLAFTTLQAQTVRLQERHVASMCFTSVAPVIGFVGGAVAFLIHHTVRAFFLGNSLGLAVAVVAFGVLGIGYYSWPRDFTLTRRILQGIGPFVAIAILGWLSGYGNSYIVQWFYRATEVARFTFAMMMSAMMQLIASALNQVWSPRFYRLVRESPERVERQNQTFYRWQAIAVGLAGGTGIALLPIATKLAGGNLVAYGSMGLQLSFIVAGYVVLSPFWHTYNYYLVHGEGLEAMHATVWTSAVGLLAWIALMWAVGPLGIYIGFLVQMALRMGALVVLARRRWSLSISWDGVAAGILLTFIGYGISRW